MPLNAQIIIFDDDEVQREYMRGELHAKGHTVVGEAGSIEELEHLLSRLSLAPDTQAVALIDNNAPWELGEEPDSKGVGTEAERIIINFFERSKSPGITVSETLSTNPQYGEHHYIVGGEVRIGEFVTKLPRKER